jgi:hypothetical protein
MRLVWDDTRRVLFVGCGRSGWHFDYIQGKRRFALWGVVLRVADIRRDTAISAGPIKPKAEADLKTETSISVIEMLGFFGKSRKALWNYIKRLFGSLIIEEFDAEIHAGFEQPDATGAVYGYYQAAMAALPLQWRRIRYLPDWTGESFRVRGRVSVAMPVYRFVGSTIRLLLSLPVKDIIRIAIRKKQGA